ncbi:MAG TPA: DUF488 domain-containing protein [Kiloniellaceae bacterium]
MAKSKPLHLAVKRAYDPPAKADGQRVLVDRVWPRGVTKEALRLDGWLKEAAPSTALRKWFGHDPAKWDGFRERYFRELDAQPEAVATLLERCARGRVTLVYGAKDSAHNQAVALKTYLERRQRQSKELP